MNEIKLTAEQERFLQLSDEEAAKEMGMTYMEYFEYCMDTEA